MPSRACQEVTDRVAVQSARRDGRTPRISAKAALLRMQGKLNVGVNELGFMSNPLAKLEDLVFAAEHRQSGPKKDCKQHEQVGVEARGPSHTTKRKLSRQPEPKAVDAAERCPDDQSHLSDSDAVGKGRERQTPRGQTASRGLCQFSSPTDRNTCAVRRSARLAQRYLQVPCIDVTRLRPGVCSPLDACHAATSAHASQGSLDQPTSILGDCDSGRPSAVRGVSSHCMPHNVSFQHLPRPAHAECERAMEEAHVRSEHGHVSPVVPQSPLLRPACTAPLSNEGPEQRRCHTSSTAERASLSPTAKLALELGMMREAQVPPDKALPLQANAPGLLVQRRARGLVPAAFPSHALQRPVSARQSNTVPDYKAGTDWTEAEVAQLKRAHSGLVAPNVRNYWKEIAKHVPGKKPFECYTKLYELCPSPGETTGRKNLLPLRKPAAKLPSVPGAPASQAQRKKLIRSQRWQGLCQEFKTAAEQQELQVKIKRQKNIDAYSDAFTRKVCNLNKKLSDRTVSSSAAPGRCQSIVSATSTAAANRIMRTGQLQQKAYPTQDIVLALRKAVQVHSEYEENSEQDLDYGYYVTDEEEESGSEVDI